MAMFSSSSKYEEAAELLEKACNNYKLAKMWREAAVGFALLADCHDKSDSKHDAATAHVDAANALNAAERPARDDLELQRYATARLGKQVYDVMVERCGPSQTSGPK